jgi:hypothetical protein
MTTMRHKVCPACQRVCAITDAYCLRCHTSLHHAKEINIPMQQTRQRSSLPGETFVTIPSETTRVDDEYLNLFTRPKLYRGVEPPAALQTDAQYVHHLVRRALIYQLLGLLALFSAICFLSVALMVTISRMFAWQFNWLPPRSMWPILVPLGYLVTLLQLSATYTALRARDHALFLVEHIRRE